MKPSRACRFDPGEEFGARPQADLGHPHQKGSVDIDVRSGLADERANALHKIANRFHLDRDLERREIPRSAPRVGSAATTVRGPAAVGGRDQISDGVSE
jgi:hypothetical protein